ncbi:MAG: hypothetical protein V1824_00490 [archaeon]
MKYLNPNRRLLKPNKNKLFNEKIIILSKELNLDENQYKMYIKAIELLKKP